MAQVVTTYLGYESLERQISIYQQATVFFCLVLAIALYLLLPATIPRHKRLLASILVFVGMYGLFSILLKTLVQIV